MTCPKYENNILCHTYKFFTRTQQDDESFDDYLKIIIELARLCQFEDTENRMIRDRIIAGINDGELRKNLFSMGFIKLNDVIGFIRSNEKNKVSDRDANNADINPSGDIHAALTNKVEPYLIQQELYELEPGECLAKNLMSFRVKHKILPSHNNGHDPQEYYSSKRIRRKSPKISNPEISCRECHKKFTSSMSLKTHQLIHSAEQPMCHKRTTGNDKLKINLRVHIGDKFKCSICHRKFISESELNMHKFQHVPGCNMPNKKNFRFEEASYNKSHGKKLLESTKGGNKFLEKNELKKYEVTHIKKRLVCFLKRKNSNIYEKKESD